MKQLRYIVAFFAIIISCRIGYAAEPHIGLNDVIATVEKSFRPLNGAYNPATKSTPEVAPPIATFSANFFQRTLLASGQRELRADGQVSVKLPDGNQPLMYRFEYFRPSQQEIVSDGRYLWIYHPENREVILSDVSFLYINPQPDRSVNFLQGLHRISKDFQVNFASGMYDPAGNYVLELQPRHSMLDTRLILMVVNKNSVMAYKSGTVPLNTSASVPSPRNQGPVPQPRSPFGTQPPVGPVISDPFPILSTTIYNYAGDSTTIEFSNIQVNAGMMDNEFNFIVPPAVQIIRPTNSTLPR